jgi:hypothetical protein
MMNLLIGFFVSAAVIAIYIWQDGFHQCPDGWRYTSKSPQPTPFNRRFCRWNPRLLTLVSLASWVLVSSTLGGWERALMFVTLPSVWLCATRPTTVDGPAIACSWVSSLLLGRGYVAPSILVATIGGMIHERSPVFAALYSLSPLPLLGLLGTLLIRKPATPKPYQGPGANDADLFVGHESLIRTIRAHKPRQDLLSWEAMVWSLRGVPLLACTPVGWISLAVSFASRLVATDTARCMVWAAPPILAAAPNVPWWFVAMHVMTFRRMV